MMMMLTMMIMMIDDDDGREEGADLVSAQLGLQHGVDQASEIRVEPFVAADEFIRKAQPRHQTCTET